MTAATVLTAEEIEAITGYKQPHRQEAELRRQGFYRARRSAGDGHVILERVHYDAICRGGGQAANEPSIRPKVRKAT